MTDIGKNGVPGDYWNVYGGISATVGLINESREEGDSEFLEKSLARLERIGLKGVESYTDYTLRVGNAPKNPPIKSDLDKIAKEATLYLRNTPKEDYDTKVINSFCDKVSCLIKGE